MTRALVVLAASVIAPTATCALFPSLDGLTHEGDAEAVDAPTAPDSAADVVDATAPDAGRFCDNVSPKPVYCEDFDEPVAIDPSTLGGYGVSGGGTLTIDTTEWSSAPRSLLATMPAVSSGSAAAAAYPSVGPSPTMVTLAFDANIEAGDTDVGISGLLTGATGLFVEVGPDGIYLQEGNYSSNPMYPTHPKHAVDWSVGWTHIEVTLTRTMSGALSSLAVNGMMLETNYACDPRFTFGAVQPSRRSAHRPPRQRRRVRHPVNQFSVNVFPTVIADPENAGTFAPR